MRKKQSTKPKTKTLNIMFVDIVDYTKTTLKLDVHSFDKLHSIFDTLIKKVAQEYNGKIINKLGDAFLLTFDCPLDAINCGLEFQEVQLEHNKNCEFNLNFELRVSINKGIVLLRNKDVFGTSVNIAARINSYCKPGEIIISERIYNEVKPIIDEKNNTLIRECTIKQIGKKKLKGIEAPIQLYSIAHPLLKKLENRILIHENLSLDQKINIIVLILIFLIACIIIINEFLIPLL